MAGVPGRRRHQLAHGRGRLPRLHREPRDDHADARHRHVQRPERVPAERADVRRGRQHPGGRGRDPADRPRPSALQGRGRRRVGRAAEGAGPRHGRRPAERHAGCREAAGRPQQAVGPEDGPRADAVPLRGGRVAFRNVWLPTGVYVIIGSAVHVGMWRSLVARFVRDEEVAGSNPVIPIEYYFIKKFVLG